MSQLNPTIVREHKVTQLRKERREIHIELLYLKRELDKSYLIYNTNICSYQHLTQRYEKLDRKLAEIDGRTLICVPFKEKKKAEKKEPTVQELIKQLSKEEKEKLVKELRGLMSVPLVK